MWRDQNDVNAPNDRSIRLIHARIKKETRFIHPRTLASISWIVFFEEICTPGGFAPLRQKLSERHGAIFSRTQKPPSVVATVEDAIGAHTRTCRRYQTMRKHETTSAIRTTRNTYRFDKDLHVLVVKRILFVGRDDEVEFSFLI